MKARLLALSGLLVLAGKHIGCGDPFSNRLLEEDAKFLTAAPTSQVIKVQLPEQELSTAGRTYRALESGEGNSDVDECYETALQGDLAYWYCFTDRFTTEVNQGVLGFLDLVDKILTYPPSARKENRRIWGPWPGKEDESVDYRFEMERCVPGGDEAGAGCSLVPAHCELGEDGVFYAYALEIRLKAQRNMASDQGWTKVMQGHSVPFMGTRYGCGVMSFDLDEAASVNQDEKGRGSLEVDYDTRPADQDEGLGEYRKIDITFRAFLPGDAEEGAEPMDATYHYLLQTDSSGEFTFLTWADLDNDNPVRNAKEKLEIATRWNQVAQGRGDVKVSKGDLLDMVAYSHECWDSEFQRVFYSDTIGMFEEEGDEGECAFGEWKF